ncbi:putative 26S proteasome regulatory subunit 6A [Blattamonas nauphoetae]|uniref:26S proteasome regulatory subunit 6A n=1 Tax=Blattamonas nauphoetae TaxID=2049346 RepID=A0ABQ9Y039_9EUKA|nr:putative 26S proteasome regulatory subunit 6A [Blattamonas nauphoetae]
MQKDSVDFEQLTREAQEIEDFLQKAPISSINAKSEAIRQEASIMNQTAKTMTYDINTMKAEMKDNIKRINMDRNLPYLVAHVVEILELPPEQGDPTANIQGQSAPKSAVVKSTARSKYFLPEIGLVDASELHPGDLVGVNNDTHLILEKLPPEHDARVKSMEIDEKPEEDFSVVGGLSKQIEELTEAVVLPMERPDLFIKVGIRPPKGVLLYGPPGTGKTLLARAVAARTHATFLKLAGPQLVQMYVGDGARMVRDAFTLAKEKEPTIIFIDELDAIGTKRTDSDRTGDKEVQRTMLELLNQLDGFTQNDKIKVVAATNRVDVLDPALLRSGRIDRKIELPNPNLTGRIEILQIHSRRMNVNADVNFEELARMTDDFNGAQLKAVCVEAGMIALRRGGTELTHEDYVMGVAEVQAKKKGSLQYYV